MELVSLKDKGVLAVWALKQDEYQAGWIARQREVEVARAAGKPVPDGDNFVVKGNDTPMWQRVTGLGTDNEWRLKPHERRGALMRLARTVERMIRVEWKNALAPQANLNDPFADGERERDYAPCRYATRTALWDPVAEICFYLEIAQSKLSDLLRQATGLRAREMSDCVRAEGIRAYLTEKMRKAGRAWLKGALEDGNRDVATISPDEGAAIVSCEYRTSEDFLDRDELVKKFGLGSRARLYRAVRLCEGIELEDLERVIALEVFIEMMPEIWTACELSETEVRRLDEDVKRAATAMMRLYRTD